MANIDGFTYTEIAPARRENSRTVRRFALTTAAGEYPTGGIPVAKASLGCPNDLESLVILESSAADAFTYKFDRSAAKIKVFKEAGSGALAEHTNSTFTSPDQLIVEATGW